MQVALFKDNGSFQRMSFQNLDSLKMQLCGFFTHLIVWEPEDLFLEVA